MAPLPKKRTPLRHVEGKAELRGDQYTAQKLEDAFRIRPHERDLPVQGVHGIHPYPGRLHPAWAGRILSRVQGDARIFDPFCGSGTALVEAMRAGFRSFGSDVNPIAVRVAKARTTRRSRDFLEAFLSVANRTHEEAARRRETPWGRMAVDERGVFPPHVLTQVINLRSAIDLERDIDLREALLIAFSPLLAKFSNRPGRQAPNVNRRAVRDHFLSRCKLMADAWAGFANELLPGLEDADVRIEDARNMRWPSHSADVIISSPPYPGVYDYAAEQAQRGRWLGASLGEARRAEIGRRGSQPQDWSHGLYLALREMLRICVQGGHIFLVLGDGVQRGKVVRADQVLRKVMHGRDLHLRRVAMVSQDRPHFHKGTADAFADRPRREHLVLLERP